MKEKTLQYENYKITVLGPWDQELPVVYVHFGQEQARAAAQEGVLLVAIEGNCWEEEFTPWPAEKAFKSGEDFTGGADAYIHKLSEEILPFVENSLGITPKCRYLAGYSLGGLFALYAMYHTTIFDGCASVSGSLWYDGFLEYLTEATFEKTPTRIYLSLGDKEAKTKNSRLQKVQACTTEAAAIYTKHKIPTRMEINPGNHFHHPEERMRKAIHWLKEE